MLPSTSAALNARVMFGRINDCIARTAECHACFRKAFAAPSTMAAWQRQAGPVPRKWLDRLQHSPTKILMLISTATPKTTTTATMTPLLSPLSRYQAATVSNSNTARAGISATMPHGRTWRQLQLTNERRRSLRSRQASARKRRLYPALQCSRRCSLSTGKMS